MKYILGSLILLCFCSSVLEVLTENNTPVILHRYIPSACNGDQEDPYQIQNRIISKEIKNDSLYISIGFAENCCLNIDPFITFDNSTLYIELSQGSQEYLCDCNCCYELTLIMTGLDNTDFITKLKGETIKLSTDPYPTYPIIYDIHQGDTINLINKYRKRQGLWLTFKDSTEQLTEKVFYTGLVYTEKNKGIEWLEKYNAAGTIVVRASKDTTWRYNDEGVLTSRNIGKGWGRTITEYYSSGNKKNECNRVMEYSKDSISRSISYQCIYWSSLGEVDSTTREIYGPR